MENVSTKYCEKCNEYKYIKTSGLCRECCPIDNLNLFSVLITGVFKQGIRDVHNFGEYIQKQYNINSGCVNSTKMEYSDGAETEDSNTDFSRVSICHNNNHYTFEKDGRFILRRQVTYNMFSKQPGKRIKQTEKCIEEATEMYESYHKSMENNTDISISTEPKVLSKKYATKLSPFKSEQLCAVANKFVDSDFYPSQNIDQLKHKKITVFEDGRFIILGRTTREEALERAVEVCRDIRNA
jgi:hypothetical protein